jgi:ribosomal protein L7/L12
VSSLGYLLVFIIVSAVAVHAFQLAKINHLRKAGIYPQKGQATDSDVERLVKSGRTTEAIKCHREVHKTTLREAKQAIETLQSK